MAIPIIQTVGLAVMTLAAIIAAGFILFDNDPLRYEFYDIKHKPFEHNEQKSKGRKESEISSENLLSLLQMGFDLEKITIGLKKFQNNAEKTVEWLLNEACNLNDSMREQIQESGSGNRDAETNPNLMSEVPSQYEREISTPTLSLVTDNPLLAFPSADNQAAAVPLDDWIHKERRAIQQRLEYLEELERSHKYQSTNAASLNVFGDEVKDMNQIKDLHLEDDQCNCVTQIEKRAELIWEAEPPLSCGSVMDTLSSTKNSGIEVSELQNGVIGEEELPILPIDCSSEDVLQEKHSVAGSEWDVVSSNSQ